ncbi:MAG: alpha/beta fold hydrolase [Pseudomonadota bacterium]
MVEILAEVNYPSEAANPPLLVIHGLFGAAKNWGALCKRFALTRPVLAVDLRNHGQSPWSDTHSYADMAEDLSRTLKAHGGTWDVLGHSMGGKAAMMLALTEPSLIDRLIVGDIAPVTYDHDQSQFINAMKSLDLAPLTRRSEADKAFAVEDPAVRAFLLQSLDFTEKPPSWRLNIATLEREMPKVLSFPDTSASHSGPTLFLSGGASHYVTAEGRAAATALFPNAEFAELEGAGHWLHAEQPNAFLEAVERFLKR